MKTRPNACARAARRRMVWLGTICAAVLFACPMTGRGQSVVDPEHGLISVASSLRGLGSVKRVLVIGAHPDDEDTELLTVLERGMGAEAAYLSLSRGEGGQNLIGPELGVGLGLIRTEELLSARRLDGAAQYFTRGYDFGYSKSAAETYSFWPRDSLLADVVWVVRRFRPQIVVSVFEGTPRDGHGQHQVAGLVAREAFHAAGDPRRFPEQLSERVRPWTPLKLYRSTRFDPAATTLEVKTGILDPLYGRSYHQIAMAGRSQHRSQDMGRIEELGARATTLELLESRVGPVPSRETALFDGIDTTLAALAEVPVRAGVREELAAYLGYLERARSRLDPWDPSSTVEPLARALRALRRLKELAAGDGAGGGELLFVLDAQEDRLERALLAAAGVVIDAFADDDLVVRGQPIAVEVVVWNGGDAEIELGRVRVMYPDGGEGALASGNETVAARDLERRRFSLSLPASAPYTVPYFLRLPGAGALYRWPADPRVRGLPFEPSPFRAEVELFVRGLAIERAVPVVYRFADQARGEVRRPVRVVPAVGVEIAPSTGIWTLGRNEPADLTVTLRGEMPEGGGGTVRLDAPPGWTVIPAQAEFRLRGPGAAAAVEFRVEGPADLGPGRYDFQAVAVLDDGRTSHTGYSVIEYPHIRRQLLFHEARASIRAFDLEIGADPPRVAYIPGAGDGTLPAIRAMKIAVDVLDGRALAAADLSGYDAIVLGIRAYETNEALLESNARLLEWARAGGTLIVQYQQYTYFNGDYAPYPLQARFPHDRVTDEAAPVRILDPGHPAFAYPNRIGPDDFDGWVQERGLYFPYEWDDRYTPLLEMADPGEEPKRGALLVAPLGDGFYVYTGLALFRQLPAGVPGAYRLLINLLSLRRDTRP